MFKNAILGLLAIAAVSCKSNAQDKPADDMAMNSGTQSYKVSKTDAEWKQILTPEEFNILREAGTERPFSSPLNEETSPGTLICAACYAPLYDNAHKFKSGTGWPSYDRAMEGAIVLDSDMKIGYKRDEAKCATCGGHLGHIFNDGPAETTGKRHCINGVALDFVPKGQELPALRK
ncbi:peptide-methionine (R)-S-oxide reductase [Nonlabens sp. Hel1_33_55]|uniref:peptide-methionine (R)-S-oxide reductase MsrB n=1 Tax=Nonlabens sp. Hel1_33_55 TaxID=1336802 RepID=UPI000875EA42|nr:peptide-methionine (R)-S-oxide reductase MsrB [Nonlabens sp. Hel1_33_55]SCX97631.1 peptide-methionine (R)-S-oxide reductase [Nonlabens sp. Hel1_33_55]